MSEARSLLRLAEDNRRILLAVILRDMKTRFGGNYFSYLVTIGWPFVHMAGLFMAYVFVTTFAPIGDDPAIFVVTGVAPYILCLYPARWMTLAVTTNLPLLQFSIVKPIHLIIARGVLEFLTAYLVFGLFYALLYALGYAIAPHDQLTVMIALGVSIYFGIATGMVGVLIAGLFGFVAILVVVGVMLLLYFTAGIFVPIVMFSESARNLMWYNPLYHCVGLFRSAYYDSYGSDDFSLAYVLCLSSGLVLIGLAGERLLRGKLMTP